MPDLVIQLATLAVSEAVNDQRSQVQKLCMLFTLQLPTFMIFVLTFMLLFIFVTQTHTQAALWTRIFKHHLDLGHNREAYEALTQNPDPSRYTHTENNALVERRILYSPFHSTVCFLCLIKHV